MSDPIDLDAMRHIAEVCDRTNLSGPAFTILALCDEVERLRLLLGAKHTDIDLMWIEHVKVVEADAERLAEALRVVRREANTATVDEPVWALPNRLLHAIQPALRAHDALKDRR